MGSAETSEFKRALPAHITSQFGLIEQLFYVDLVLLFDPVVELGVVLHVALPGAACEALTLREHLLEEGAGELADDQVEYPARHELHFDVHARYARELDLFGRNWGDAERENLEVAAHVLRSFGDVQVVALLEFKVIIEAAADN